jgi:replicative DNA helicase
MSIANPNFREKPVPETYGPITGLADEIWSEIEKRHELAPGAITGLSSGFPKLDDLIDGLRPETLTLVGARPKQGKTALILSMIMSAAKRGIPTSFFSLEMPKKQVVSRLIGMEAEIDHRLMVRGVYDHEEALRLSAAAFEIERWPIFIDDATSLTPSAFVARAQRAVKSDGARIIFLDYLQRMKPERTSGRYEEVTAISMAMADARKTLKIPIVAAAQLNRGGLERSRVDFSKLKDRAAELTRPNDGELRDSGQLEQDGDAVIFLNRPIVVIEKHKPDEADRDATLQWEDACSHWRKRAELNVYFNRAGPSGFVNLLFEGPQMLFRPSPL